MRATARDTEREALPADVVGRHRTGLARRTALISGLTLISRLLGFVREILSASLFGHASGLFDAFLTAWRVPNLFRRFLGEGAISAALQTKLTEVDHDRGEAAGRALFLATAGLVTRLLVVITALTMLGAYYLPDDVSIAGTRVLGADAAELRELVVRLSPFVILICLTAIASGGLQVRGHFAAPAFAPVVLNIVWIASLVVVGVAFDGFVMRSTVDPTLDRAREVSMVRGLAWGVLFAGVCQLLVQLPALRHTRLVGGKPADAEGRAQARAGARAVLKRSLPLALGAAVYQVNVMVDGLMAESLLPNGGPTAHYFANRVQQFPMALISIAATSAVFPALAALGKTGDRDGLRGLHDRTQRAVAFVALPASAGLFALASPIMSSLFEHGRYGPEGVARAADALRALSFAILPAGAVGLCARTYYALGDFRTPAVVSIAMLVLNFGLNLLLIVGLDYDVDGLAWATALTSWANLAVLWPGLSGKLGLPHVSAGFVRGLGGSVAAATASGLAAWAAWTFSAPHFGTLLATAFGIAAGVGAEVLVAVRLDLPEARLVRERLGKARRKPPAA
ncbi:MAG: murein biosynthesis integral membrane protein MurJ [Planctomycetes bacterium]|nr:murein biosynthesis integral membrane protein MurJ [Planctomycetota bacterium]MCB9905094.1 murein biosynthesis integral membrane protein MurJ [Planctomycetota bacterium]